MSKASPITKLDIALFLEDDMPFINEMLNQLNTIDLTKYNYTLSVYNMIDKLSHNDITRRVTNHIKSLKFHNNITSIKSISFEDMNFNIKFPCHLDIKSNKPNKLYLHPKIYNRLHPILDDEESSELLIVSSDNITYKITPEVFTNDFIVKIDNNIETSGNISSNMASLKNIALQNAIDNNADYYVYIDNKAYITEPNIVKTLIQNINSTGADIITPALVNSGGLGDANFWIKSNEEGEAEMTKYYIPILQRRLRNTWDIVHLDNFYIIPRKTLNQLKPDNLYTTAINDKVAKSPSIVFSSNMVELKIRMLVESVGDYGWLINNKNYETSTTDNILIKERVHPDLYQMKPNRQIWHRKYLSPKFIDYIEKDSKMKFTEPPKCRDMFDWQCFTDVFCSDLIDECEKHDGWSTGSNKDERIGGGYENVPTRDIHLKQIGLGETWEIFVNEYVAKVVGENYSKLATQGYYIAFVARYTMDTQRELNAHHDASVTSTVTCLNTEFEGGGTHFVRQNYTHNPKKCGVTTVHPGRCTHFHSGKAITSGKRYILVSFNN